MKRISEMTLVCPGQEFRGKVGWCLWCIARSKTGRMSSQISMLEIADAGRARQPLQRRHAWTEECDFEIIPASQNSPLHKTRFTWVVQNHDGAYFHTQHSSNPVDLSSSIQRQFCHGGVRSDGYGWPPTWSANSPKVRHSRLTLRSLLVRAVSLFHATCFSTRCRVYPRSRS